MKVLHVIASGARRGAEVFASDLVRSLAEFDIQQHVVALHGPRPDALELAAPSEVLRPDTRDFSASRFSPGLLSSLRRVIRDSHPDLLQAHGGEALKYLSVARLRHPPIVYRRIGAVTGEIRHRSRRAAAAAQVRRAARVIAVADAIRRETIDVFKLPAHRVVLIPNAVDPRRLEPTTPPSLWRKSVGVPKDAKLILYVGAFTWEKDPVANLEIALRVLGRVPDAYLVMMGDGPLRRQVESACRRGATAGRVLVLGSRTDVANALGAADMLLSASRTEGMPGNLIEAGYAGVPVAAYNISGIPEIVVDGVTGVVADRGDAAALASQVAKLLNDRAARAAMGSAARARCTSMFDIRAVAPRYLEVYEELAARPSGALPAVTRR